jgi:hypothetical protein
MRLCSGVESLQHSTAGGDDAGRDGEFASSAHQGVSYEFVLCRGIVVNGHFMSVRGLLFANMCQELSRKTCETALSLQHLARDFSQKFTRRPTWFHRYRYVTGRARRQEKAPGEDKTSQASASLAEFARWPTKPPGQKSLCWQSKKQVPSRSLR